MRAACTAAHTRQDEQGHRVSPSAVFKMSFRRGQADPSPYFARGSLRLDESTRVIDEFSQVACIHLAQEGHQYANC